MDTATLVTRNIAEGRRVLDHLAGQDIPVRAACWIKLQDRFEPSLYIATPLVDREGITAAYRRVLDSIRSLDGAWLGASDVTVVGEKHPLVAAVSALPGLMREGRLPPTVGMFGGLAVDEVYVYPPSEAFPGFNQIKQTYPSAELVQVDLPLNAINNDPKQKAVVRSLLWKVNAAGFAGRNPESLLFYGGESDPAKNLNRVVFIHRPEGWNTVYDPSAKQWRRIVLEGANRPVYEPVDFAPLLELKSPPAASA